MSEPEIEDGTVMVVVRHEPLWFRFVVNVIGTLVAVALFMVLWMAGSSGKEGNR